MGLGGTSAVRGIALVHPGEAKDGNDCLLDDEKPDTADNLRASFSFPMGADSMTRVSSYSHPPDPTPSRAPNCNPTPSMQRNRQIEFRSFLGADSICTRLRRVDTYPGDAIR